MFTTGVMPYTKHVLRKARRFMSLIQSSDGGLLFICSKTQIYIVFWMGYSLALNSCSVDFWIHLCYKWRTPLASWLKPIRFWMVGVPPLHRFLVSSFAVHQSDITCSHDLLKTSGYTPPIVSRVKSLDETKEIWQKRHDFAGYKHMVVHFRTVVKSLR